LKPKQLLRVLALLGYAPIATKGSHVKLAAAGRPTLTFAFHAGATISPGVVRDILMKQVGLDKDDALKAVHGDI
jgi:predicted RNA binding protein YcfA (HicA-like mRNA interferase family)